MVAAYADDFTVSLTVEDGRTVVLVRGELDVATAGRLRDTLTDVHGTGATEVVLDASQLTFCDSTGLSVLLTAERRWRDEGGRFLLRRPSAALLRLFELTGVASVFRVEPAEG